MKTLHLLKTAVGASWALRQTRELVNLGVEVHVAMPEGPMVEKYRHAGVHVHILQTAIDLKRPWKNIAAGRSLRKLVKALKVDFVHSHFVATTLLMRMALKGVSVKRIFHVPGPLHLEHWFFKRAEIMSADSNDYWLASCRWTRTCYEESGIAPERIGLAYYGVNASDFQSGQQAQEKTLRESLGLNADTFLIGMVAYFYSPKQYLGQTRGLKGHEDLIDALAIVKRERPDIACVFVGGPWGDNDAYFNNVKKYAEMNVPGVCHFLGHRNDVPTLYPQFDLAVHPSHSENVGGAVESMYAGVATLTSDVGGFPDLVTDGETGYMAPSRNPKQLAQKIIEAMDNEQERMRRVSNASERVQEVMNVEHNARQVYDFYLALLSADVSDSVKRVATHG